MANFSKYLHEILESGEFESHNEAAKYIGISPSHFSMILNSQRRNPNWMVAEKIIRAHASLTGADRRA